MKWNMKTSQTGYKLAASYWSASVINKCWYCHIILWAQRFFLTYINSIRFVPVLTISLACLVLHVLPNIQASQYYWDGVRGWTNALRHARHVIMFCLDGRQVCVSRTVLPMVYLILVLQQDSIIATRHLTDCTCGQSFIMWSSLWSVRHDCGQSGMTEPHTVPRYTCTSIS